MTKINTKTILRKLCYGIAAIVLVFAYFPNMASAGAITPRKVVMGSSIANASTAYNFTFTTASATSIQGITFQACANANVTAGCGTTPAAFSSAGSSLSGQTGLGGTGTWVNDTGTPSTLAVHNATAVTTPGIVTVNFSSVHNPSATNAPFYLWITTYSTYSGSYSGALDTGVIAVSTAGLVTVNATVDETLAFTLATTNVSLGAGTSMSTSSASTGTSSMTATTNASTGYSITYTGTTLAGPVVITAMNPATTSSTGSKQFGFNLTKSGVGTGVVAPASGYDVGSTYKFLSGETIAQAAGPTALNTFTVNYIANIDAATPAGQYSTAITYIATGNF